MTTAFIAVVRAKTSTDGPALLAAGATAVLSWAELAQCTEADDVPAVLFDRSPGRAGESAEATLAAVLGALTSVDPPARRTEDSPDVVIATVRPVVDTLKWVDAAGTVTGTASREGHRFVGLPIAARLRVLRAVAPQLAESTPNRLGPPPLTVLTALVSRGATVFGAPSP
jgi:hypothetical protein